MPVRSSCTENRELPSLHSKNMVEVLRKTIALTREHDAILQCPDVSYDTAYHTMNTSYFKKFIDKLQSDGMK